MIPSTSSPDASRTPLVTGATLGAAALAFVILLADIYTPLGVADGVLYVVPLLIASLSGPPRFHLMAAGVASGLTLLGAWLSPHVGGTMVDTTNRAISVGVLWITAILVGRFRSTGLALQTRTKDLAAVNHALDQSAIVATTNTLGVITYANDRFCEISRYSREELVGQDHRLLNSRLHPKEFMQDLWGTIASGRIWRGEIRNRAKDGGLYWVDTTIVPFLDERGKPYQYMAIRYEVTERKRSEELLREQAALARLGQMAAVVAHEVKNPIAGIRGALQVIGSRMPNDSRDRPIVGQIIERLDALNGIVQDLLVFARPRQLRTEVVDLKALVASTSDLMTRDPSLAGLQVAIEGEAAPTRADREQLQIVFHNVLMNAAQAMAGRGTIAVGIRRTAGGWTLTVADQGPGMPPEVQAQAFEAFFTTKHRGTGLGLPTARRIIEAHRGTIDIDTAPERGTIVSIHLPAGP